MRMAMDGAGTRFALKVTLSVLGCVVLFGAGLVADDFVGIRTWVGEHKTATEIHNLQYLTLQREVKENKTARRETMAILMKIAEKLEVD